MVILLDLAMGKYGIAHSRVFFVGLEWHNITTRFHSCEHWVSELCNINEWGVDSGPDFVDWVIKCHSTQLSCRIHLLFVTA